jgi:hypothetical protein
MICIVAAQLSFVAGLICFRVQGVDIICCFVGEERYLHHFGTF